MSYHEFTIKIADVFRDALIQRLSGTSCLGMIENREGIIAYFPETVDVKAIRDDLTLLETLLEKTGNAGQLTFESVLIPEQDWNESWKKSFQPIDVGSFTILPPWEGPRSGRINLVIDPAMAFGTGHHETTRSCLVLMDKYAAAPGIDGFLDVGTGTGILAIAAAKRGWRNVIGVDTDLLAVEAALKNIELNRVSGVHIREGSISDVGGRFGRITANIISGVLIQLAPEIAAHLSYNGTAILSGILKGQDDDVIEAMEEAGLKLIERYDDGKWRSLVMSPAT